MVSGLRICWSRNVSRPVKNSLFIAGIFLVVTGAVWVLQGITVLPGRFMTGQTKWAIIGAVCFVVGFGSMIVSRLF